MSRDKIEMKFGSMDLKYGKMIGSRKELLSFDCHQIKSIHLCDTKTLDIEDSNGEVERTFSSSRLLITANSYSGKERHIEITLFADDENSLTIQEVEDCNTILYPASTYGMIGGEEQ